MRQAGTAGGARFWAARLLMVCALAVCAAAMHSPDPMSSVAAVAMSPAGADTGGQATALAAPDVHADGMRPVAAGAHEASVDAPGQDTGCGCCPHDAATCCAATTEDPSPHGCVGPGNPGGRDCAFPAALQSDFCSHGSLAAPPSLSELSLLRI
jgi:hypothetical protein